MRTRLLMHQRLASNRHRFPWTAGIPEICAQNELCVLTARLHACTLNKACANSTTQEQQW